MDLIPLGDRAWLASFADEVEASRWAESVRGRVGEHPGVVDVVLAYRTVAVHADPDREDLGRLEASLRMIEPVPGNDDFGGERPPFVIPVLYDGEDLGDVAGRVGLSVEEVRLRHSGPSYAIWAIGFLPGFPYAGPLTGPLGGLPRRDDPRPRVPAGAVAIAAGQTCIYPRSSPGGWHLLGRTPLVIADLDDGFFPLRAGDRLRFEPIDEAQFRRMEGRRLCRAGGDAR